MSNQSNRFSSRFAALAPYTIKTRQMLRRQFGQTSEQLPAEYVQLENQVDRVKEIYNKLLVFSQEDYDYPLNIREFILDWGKHVGARVKELTNQKSSDQIPTASEKCATSPKTLCHALSRAAAAASQEMEQNQRLQKALNEFASTQERVGNARLNQDRDIQKHFLTPLQRFKEGLNGVTAARKLVIDKRLNLDEVKVKAKNVPFDKANAANAEVERAEDDFITSIEESVALMKDIIESQVLIDALMSFIRSQHEFHLTAAKILENISTNTSI